MIGNIAQAIDKIAWGGTFTKVKNSEGRNITVIIKPPTLRDRNWIEFIYQEALKEAFSLGVFSERELKKELELRYIWGPRDEKVIEEVQEGIKKIDTELEAVPKNSRGYKRLVQIKYGQAKRLEEVFKKKDKAFEVTAERYADMIKLSSIVFCSTYNENECRHWEDWDSFNKEKDVVLISNIALNVCNYQYFSEKDIRAMARSASWRTLWNSSKTIGGLFDKPLIELDIEQKALLYWSNIYDSVYEAYERPSDDIIMDDEKLDRWIDSQCKKKRSDRVQAGKEDGKIKLSKNIRHHGEIFIVANKDINPDAPEIKDIASLNTDVVTKFKQREIEKIKKVKTINEKDLRRRGDKYSRGIIGAKDAVIDIKSRGGKTTKNVRQKFPGGTL
jgi:hypothetical protein